jgi:hypothetical protein
MSNEKSSKTEREPEKKTLPVPKGHVPGTYYDVAGSFKKAANMTPEQLAKHLSFEAKKFKDWFHKNLGAVMYAHQLWAKRGRYAPRVPIAGKPTWAKFCKQHLGVTDRYIRLLIGGISSQAQGKSRGSTSKSRAIMIVRVLGTKLRSTLIALFGLLEEKGKLPIVQAALAQFVAKQQKANGPVLVQKAA